MSNTESPLEKAIIRDLISQGHSQETILQTCQTPELGLDINEVSNILKKEEVGQGVVNRSSGVETMLSPTDFRTYFEKDRLGKLYLPNGIRYAPEKDWPITDGAVINLKKLYKLMIGWKVQNETEVPVDDIVAIIAFGSAIRYPGYDIFTESSRKYLGLFGPKIEKEKKRKIYPNDVDFFVLTGKNITRHEYIKPDFATIDFGSAGWANAMKEGGINLVNRGVSQLMQGISQGDTISVSALREGIPLFYREDFEEVRARTGIPRETPRRLFWNENDNGYLIGNIG